MTAGPPDTMPAGGTPPSPGPVKVPYEEIAARVDQLIALFEAHPDVMIRDRVEELLQCIDALHRAPLQRLDALLDTYGWDGGGMTIPPLERALNDPLIRRLFELYDLAPVEMSAETQREEVERALGQVRPYVESHGGGVRAASVERGVVTVELAGHCRGCTASQATLRGVVEQALRDNVTGFERMEIIQTLEDVAPHPPPVTPVMSLQQLLATLPPTHAAQASPGRGAR